MKIAHEAPLGIINQIQMRTDYDYALVHLFEESEAYYKFFKEAVAKGRYVILDNSIFELGEAFDADKFAHYVQALKPAAYIVPDVLEDSQGTIANFEEWNKKYENVPGLKIGVVQGKDYDDICRCYDYMNQKADIIAISFDYSYYEEQYPDEETKYHSWARGRQELLTQMLSEGKINQQKPHHLLGAGLPQEFAYYKLWDWIDSVDTSNPVVHGLKGIRYERQPQYDIYGLSTKDSTKLFTMIDDKIDLALLDDVYYNIDMFRHNLRIR